MRTTGDRPVPLDRLTGEAQIEALNESRDARRVHLEPVAGAEVSQDLRLGPGDASEVDEFAEEALEAGGGDDLQDPGGFIAGVPERVPLVARLENQINRTGDQHLIAQKRADTPLQDVARVSRWDLPLCGLRARSPALSPSKGRDSELC